MIEQVGKEHACHTTYEQRGGKCSAHATATVGSGCSKHLECAQSKQEHQHCHHIVLVGIEKAVVKDACNIAVDQTRNVTVTLTVERRHQEDEHTQCDTAHGETYPSVSETLETCLNPVDEADEVERDKAAEDAQQNHKRDARCIERLTLREKELDIVSGENIGHRSTGHRRRNQRDCRSCCQVEHQHLDSEQHACYRGLEDTGNTRSSATGHQHSEFLGGQAEGLTQVAADGGTREHDRTLGTDRSTKADGERRGDERRVHVMNLEAALFERQGIQHAGHTMRYGFTCDVIDITAGQQDTDSGKNKI